MENNNTNDGIYGESPIENEVKKMAKDNAVKKTTKRKTSKRKPKKPAEIDFENFREDLEHVFMKNGLARDGYNEEILHVKVDMLLHTLLEKGIIKKDELFGEDNLVKSFMKKNKEYLLRK